MFLSDKPTPPQSCTVTDVFYDNCVVHWTPPLDDGGTEIKSYIVEAMDVTKVSEGWSIHWFCLYRRHQGQGWAIQALR